MKTFKRWCEDSGRRSTGCSDYAEFERNAQDYEKYREQEERRIKLEKQGGKRMIQNMLELSTAHIPVTNRFELGIEIGPFRVEKHDYGYIVFVSAAWQHDGTVTPEDMEVAMEGVAEWLVPIYTHAIKHGCGIINFDADGPIVEEFKTYE